MIMPDKNHGCAHPSRLAQQHRNAHRADRIKRVGRLVGQKQERSRSKGAGDADPLRLADRHLARQPIRRQCAQPTDCSAANTGERASYPANPARRRPCSTAAPVAGSSALA